MRKLLALVIAMTVGSANAFLSIVFDPTNFTKNTITAAQTIQQTATQAQAYLTQLQQYRSQLLQLQSMDPQKVSGLLAQNGNDMRDAARAAGALQTLYGSVQNLQGSFTQRLDTAKALNMTWNDYVGYEQDRLNKNQAAAVERAREDFRVMERVQQDYKFAQDAEALIPATAGTHEAMQLMNTQMNRVITQNAELMRGLTAAMAGGNSAEQQAQANAAKQRELVERNNRMEISRARREGDKAAIDAWKSEIGK